MVMKPVLAHEEELEAAAPEAEPVG